MVIMKHFGVGLDLCQDQSACEVCYGSFQIQNT